MPVFYWESSDIRHAAPLFFFTASRYGLAMNESDDNGKTGWRPAIWEILLLSAVVFSLILAIFFASGASISAFEDVLGVIIVGGGSIGLILAALRTKAMSDQNRLTQQSLELNTKTEANTRLAKAFTDAINQLGNKDNKHTRAGGAHALGKIALEDWRRANTEKGYESAYYNTCIDILSGFLRSRCGSESIKREKTLFEKREKIPGSGPPVWEAENYRLPVDIEAGLTALSKCNGITSGAHPIDLIGADLRCWHGLTLPLNLTKAMLGDANMDGLTIRNCNLTEVNFARCTATNLNFEYCYFTQNVFSGLGCTLGDIVIDQSIVMDVDFISSGGHPMITLRNSRLTRCNFNEFGYGENCAIHCILDDCTFNSEIYATSCLIEEGASSSRVISEYPDSTGTVYVNRLLEDLTIIPPSGPNYLLFPLLDADFDPLDQ